MVLLKIMFLKITHFNKIINLIKKRYLIFLIEIDQLVIKIKVWNRKQNNKKLKNLY